jgi:5'-nucleotidase
MRVFRLAIVLCATSALPWTLPVVHLNDIHAHLEPTELDLRVGEETVSVRDGGLAAIRGAVDGIRAGKGEILLLHAGDEFSGTPWFSLYQGRVDAAVLRRLRPDAFVPGNHDFDKGPATLRRFLDSSGLPATAANLDASREPELAGRIRRCVVVERSGRRVGVVGVALPSTPSISSPGPNLVFRAAVTVAPVVDSLRKAGVRTVLLLTHAGIEEDTVLARTVPGIAAVVGGHSHTRMGRELSSVGLSTNPTYPVVVPGASGWSVPVVQAWEWGKEVGEIDLDLDDSGRPLSWKARPFLVLSDTLARGGAMLPESVAGPIRERLKATGVARFPRPDRGIDSILHRFEGPVDSLRRSVVARLPGALKRGDPRLADLCARALRRAGSSVGAQVGLQNAGGVRDDLPAGPVTSEQVLKVMPFGNTVVVVRITGAQLRSLRGQFAGRPGRPDGWDGVEVDASGALRVGGRAIGDGDSVAVATNSYLASGGDGCKVLARAGGFRRDPGISDAEALSDLLRELHPADEPLPKDGTDR